MNIKIVKVGISDIESLRLLFLQEFNHQVRYNANFPRGWADTYFLSIDDVSVGYGAVKGQEIPDRDTIFEFYTIPECRKYSSALFRELISISGVKYIECQTNDFLLSSMLYEFGEKINSDTILFEDNSPTNIIIPGIKFRLKEQDDQVFKHVFEPPGDYVLELGGEIIASGGYMLYYNFPFADIYYEVKKEYHRNGYGSFLAQELKKSCYLKGRVPAARTGINNYASRGTLLKAGFKVSGFMIKGAIK